jgi:hypothetical protein
MSRKVASIGDSGRAVTQMKIFSSRQRSGTPAPGCLTTTFVPILFVLPGSLGDKTGTSVRNDAAAREKLVVSTSLESATRVDFEP